MKNKQLGLDVNSGLARLGKFTIALFALVAAGLAFQLGNQPQFIAYSHAMSQSQPQSGGVLETPVNRLIKKDPARYSADKSSAYCPVGQRSAGDGSNKSFCDKLWRKESLLAAIEDTGIFSWTRNAVEKGASALSPAIQFLAGNCLSFLK